MILKRLANLSVRGYYLPMENTHKLNPNSLFQGRPLTDLFESDLRFFQLLLVLINKSCPIKNIDLMWNSDEPSGPILTQITGTIQASQSLCSHLVRDHQVCQAPRFCQIVDPGCRNSDQEAAKRAGITGKPEVYVCHAGLIDVAVPVMCDGQHIATLFTGQVLLAQPDDASFDNVRQRVDWLPDESVPALRQAYAQVPVVLEEDIRHTVLILQIFADYLSTAWKRLLTSLATQELQLRDTQLLRKEMAHLLLNGAVDESARLREIARTLKMTTYPNRVMVIARPAAPESEEGPLAQSFDLASTRVLYAIEDITANMRNVTVVGLRRGICVFFTTDTQAGEKQGEIKAYALAQRLAHHVFQRCGIPIHIGVGRHREEWSRLAESYNEALAALTSSKSTVCIYKGEPEAVRSLRSQVRSGCDALLRRDFEQARSDLRMVPSIATRHLGNNQESIPMIRQFLHSSLDALLHTAHKLGSDADAVERWRLKHYEGVRVASGSFELREVWLDCIESVIGEIKRLYSGKHPQLIHRACQEIERSIERPNGACPISLPELAHALGVSRGHLSRTFKKVMGLTLERFMMQKQIERAVRLLLDPTGRVSEVAEKCGFSNPAYFARVFRKIVGCSPTEFSKHPVNYGLGSQSEGRKVEPNVEFGPEAINLDLLAMASPMRDGPHSRNLATRFERTA